VGATNVARVIGKRAGLVTLLGDVLKGAVGVLVASLLAPRGAFPAAAAAAVVCGHCFSLPPFLKGGKGVATALGAVIALHVWSGVVAIAAFAAVFALTGIVSLSSLIAALIVPVSSLLMNLPEAATVSYAVIAGVVILRHRDNIHRLVEGREAKFRFRQEAE